MRCQGFNIKAEVRIKDLDVKKMKAAGTAVDAFTFSAYIEIELPNKEQLIRDLELERAKQKQEEVKEKSDKFRP
ncbi:MAG: hypothetical protein H0U18_07245 [Pyrinomonadaceae bacterium]|jgi:hypothetical protein|nr:hypothetical protein [Pyrinomonadaceae bacterium]